MKTLKMRIITWVLTVCTLLGMITPALAATPEEALAEVNIYNADFDMTYLYMGNSAIHTDYVYFLRDGKQIPAYCTTPHNWGVQWVVPKDGYVPYTLKSAVTDPKVLGIIANGYPHKSYQELGLENAEQGFYATKAALWCYLRSDYNIDNLKVNSSLTGGEMTRAQNLLAATKKIYNAGIGNNVIPTPSLTISALDTVAVDGGAHYYQRFEISSGTWTDGLRATINLTGENEVGAKVSNMSGSFTNSIDMSGTNETGFKGYFQVIYPISSGDSVGIPAGAENKSGSINLTATATVYQYAIYSVTPKNPAAVPSQYSPLQDYIADVFDPTTNLTATTLSNWKTTKDDTVVDEDDPPPSIPLSAELVVRKYATGTTAPLSGAIFEVRNGSGQLVGTYATNTGGSFSLSVDAGTYFVTEVSPPMNYLLGSVATQNVTLYEGGSRTLTFYNDPYGNLRVEKRNADNGAVLSGAVVRVRNIVTGTTYTETTGVGGAFTLSKIVPGAYEVTELTSPDGYVLDGTKYTVNVTTGQTATVTLQNNAEPGLTIVKYDADTMDVLPNVTFEVYRNAALLGTYTTNASGQINLLNLQPGTYLVKEVSAGGTHVVDSTPQQIELTAGGGIARLVFFNRLKPGIFITKVDGLTLAPIPGVLFRIQKVGDSLYQEYTTNTSGEITLTGLEPGAYTVTEVSAPNGYLMDDASRVIQINAGESAQFVFTNTRKPGLSILKYDTATGTYLQGATFRIGKIEDGAQYLSRTTDANGRIDLTGLDAGVYSVTEIAAPDGYVLDSTPHYVQLYPGQTSTLIVENKAKPALQIIKTDAATGARLAGATFTVALANGPVLTTATTNASGVALVEGLEPGTYYITETEPPAGYLINSNPQFITLEPNRTGTLQFSNYRKPSLTIIKYDADTKKPLANVTFEIYRDTVLVGMYTTNAAGKISLYDLRPGTYLVREVSSDGDHVVNSTPREIAIKEASGETATLVFFNFLKPGIYLTKVDSGTLKPLPNATYRIQKVGGSFSKEYTTGANGEINLTGLEPGAYTVTETKAPDGYLIDNATRTIQINAGENAQFVFTDTVKPSIVVVKYDPNTGKYLAGATFRIARIQDGTNYLDRVTGTDGKIVITGLEPGVYSVKETAAPSGYVLNDTEYHVELFPGEVSQIVVNNEAKPNLQIIKTDAVTGERLAAATFTVKKADGATVTSVTTDTNGEAFIKELDPGVYTITETTPPVGYLPNGKVQSITLTPNHTGVVQFENYPKPELTIHKIDSITGDPIKGAKFHILYASNNTFAGELRDLGFYYSDEDGIISLSGLEDGWYRITEVEPAKGYAIKDPVTQDVFIQRGTGKGVTFENVPLSAIIIRKVDAITGAPLQGAKFQVRYLGGTSGSGGTVIGNYTTSVNGTIVITGLTAGMYVIEETKAPDGYTIDEATQTVYLSGKDQDVVTVEFPNAPESGLLIRKLDSATGKPLAGATFKVTDSIGVVTGTGNGIYKTDASGQILIPGLPTGAYIVQETTAPDGYVMDSASQTVALTSGKLHTLTFYNTRLGGLTIIKSDEQTGARIKGARFEVRKVNGAIVGYYTTDANGVIRLPNADSGWYTVTEIKAADGYILDATPHSVQVKDGKTATLEIFNRAKSGILIHKQDATTDRGIYGVTFLLYDGNHNPIGQYTTDQSGSVLINDNLTAGRYYLRELSTATGYELDTELKTVYVEAGKTIEIRWENQPMRGQIQITKKSGDANELNGFPTGTPLAGAVFEAYDYRTGNLMSRFVSGTDGRAVSAPLPLGRYIVKEVQSPLYYILSGKALDVELELAGQIVKHDYLNFSANTGVAIRKTGNRETQPGDEIRYTINEVRNTSTVPLTDFYWRDILPADTVRLTRIVTGSYNQSLKYKVMITTNKGDTRIIADNLSTTKNNVIDCSNAALGLKSDEYVTSFTLLCGMVQAGFSAVEQPQVYVKVLPGLSHQYQFTNRADVGGKYGDTWVVGNTAWVTSIYKKPEPLPKTGY